MCSKNGPAVKSWYFMENPNTGDTEPGLYCYGCACHLQLVALHPFDIVTATNPDPIKSCVVCGQPVQEEKP